MNTPRHQFAFCHDEESVCVNTSAVQLDDILRKFEDYLRACGFYFDGHVTICNEDECPHVAPADLDPTEDGKEAL